MLDQAHRKRNLAEYEGEMDVGEHLVEAMLRVARDVEQRVKEIVNEGADVCKGRGESARKSAGTETGRL